MRQLSEKVASIAPSATMEISDTAKRMQRQGIDVVSLSIGEPDFDTPRHIKDACIDALLRGETHYAPSNGIPELLSLMRIANGAFKGPLRQSYHLRSDADASFIECFEGHPVSIAQLAKDVIVGDVAII